MKNQVLSFIFFINACLTHNLAYAQVLNGSNTHLFVIDQNQPLIQVFQVSDGSLAKAIPTNEPIAIYNANIGMDELYFGSKHFGYVVDGKTLEIKKEFKILDELGETMYGSGSLLQKVNLDDHVVPLSITSKGEVWLHMGTKQFGSLNPLYDARYIDLRNEEVIDLPGIYKGASCWFKGLDGQKYSVTCAEFSANKTREYIYDLSSRNRISESEEEYNPANLVNHEITNYGGVKKLYFSNQLGVARPLPQPQYPTTHHESPSKPKIIVINEFLQQVNPEEYTQKNKRELEGARAGYMQIFTKEYLAPYANSKASPDYFKTFGELTWREMLLDEIPLDDTSKKGKQIVQQHEDLKKDLESFEEKYANDIKVTVAESEEYFEKLEQENQENRKVQTKYLKAMQAWQKSLTPPIIAIDIYEDEAKTNLLLSVKGSTVHILNDLFLCVFVDNMGSYDLYDLETLQKNISIQKL